jgi:recombination protein RecT
MTTAALKEVVTGVSEKPKDFPTMLTAWLPEIKRALPKHLNADRMARIALTAFRRTPKLAECDPRSVFAAVIQASQLGLEPDTLGRSYLIPYKVNKKLPNGKWESHHECQFIPGWKGLVDLMNRSGQGTVYTGVIFKDQDFRFVDGSKRELEITNETGLVDPSEITHAYAVGHIKGGMFPVIELWRMAKVLKHRDRYNKVGDKHYSYENLEMYARKVVLLQVLKYMPCSPELATAMALNDAAETGLQRIDIKDAIEGTWEPAPDDPEADPAAEAGGSGGEKKDEAQAGSKADAPSDATTLFQDVTAVIERARAIGLAERATDADKAVALAKIDDAESMSSELAGENFESAKKAIAAARDEIRAKKVGSKNSRSS